MARPCKSVETQSRHNTKEEVETRKKVEQSLKSGTDKIIPPKYLNTKQKRIFKNIVEQLKASDILCNLDVFVLTTCSIAIERLAEIETQINNDIGLLSIPAFMASKEKYTKDFFRCCNELSLSPQARSKIGSLALSKLKKEEDPLLQVLKANKGDGGD